VAKVEVLLRLLQELSRDSLIGSENRLLTRAGGKRRNHCTIPGCILLDFLPSVFWDGQIWLGLEREVCAFGEWKHRGATLPMKLNEIS